MAASQSDPPITTHFVSRTVDQCHIGLVQGVILRGEVWRRQGFHSAFTALQKESFFLRFLSILLQRHECRSLSANMRIPPMEGGWFYSPRQILHYLLTRPTSLKPPRVCFIAVFAVITSQISNITSLNSATRSRSSVSSTPANGTCFSWAFWAGRGTRLIFLPCP